MSSQALRPYQLSGERLVVCGRNKRLYRKITELKRLKRARNLICLGFTEEVPALMKVSDVLLGKAGGITVSEAMASRLPVVIYRPIPGQEFYNVDYLVNEGAALYARNTDDAVAKIKFLYEHPDRLKEMKQKTARIGKPNATRNICATLNYLLNPVV
ncbi:MAG: glycosyltransferase [Planctomycetes bacterium]|nr:glycosyltransferase [Planctomycetota bacterium]